MTALSIRNTFCEHYPTAWDVVRLRENEVLSDADILEEYRKSTKDTRVPSSPEKFFDYMLQKDVQLVHVPPTDARGNSDRPNMLASQIVQESPNIFFSLFSKRVHKVSEFDDAGTIKALQVIYFTCAYLPWKIPQLFSKTARKLGDMSFTECESVFSQRIRVPTVDRKWFEGDFWKSMLAHTQPYRQTAWDRYKRYTVYVYFILDKIVEETGNSDTAPAILREALFSAYAYLTNSTQTAGAKVDQIYALFTSGKYANARLTDQLAIMYGVAPEKGAMSVTMYQGVPLIQFPCVYPETPTDVDHIMPFEMLIRAYGLRSYAYNFSTLRMIGIENSLAMVAMSALDKRVGTLSSLSQLSSLLNPRKFFWTSKFALFGSQGFNLLGKYLGNVQAMSIPDVSKRLRDISKMCDGDCDGIYTYFPKNEETPACDVAVRILYSRGLVPTLDK